MANWKCNDGFKQQKKRTFIYKSSPQDKNNDASNLKSGLNYSNSIQHVGAYSSPRKKIKSSYSFYDKAKSDQKAAEDLCNDLPIDAFEDDVLGDLGDDFTVEELCEVADQTERQLTQAFPESNVNKHETKSTKSDLLEEFFGHKKADVQVDVPKKKLNESYFPFSPTKLHKEEPRTQKSFSNGSFLTNISKPVQISSQIITKQMSTTSTSKEINYFKDLENKLKTSEERIKQLEETNYEKDGNLKMLQDSLEHLKSEESKNKEKLKTVEDQKRTEIKELQKNFAKTVEQLNSKICFQEQELKQAKSQRQALRKQEFHVESPKRSKPGKVFNNTSIPCMGQSFYEKGLSETLRSPSPRKNVKLQKSPEKIIDCNQLQTEFKTKETNKDLEKKILKSSEKTSSLEIAQKLFQLPDIESTVICSKYNVPNDHQSLLSLLKQDLNAFCTTATENINSFGGANSLNASITSSHLDSREVRQAIQGIQELVDTNVETSKSNGSYIKLVENCNVLNILDTSPSTKCCISLLSLLQHHIKLYTDLCIDKDDETLANSCPPSPPATLELKDKDSVVALSRAYDAAVQSLRCLGVLVNHSSEVCEVLLKQSSSSKEEGLKTEQSIQGNNASANGRAQADNTELLSLLFKLAVYQSNELPSVNIVALSVLETLARNCPECHRSWFYPMLCDVLLPQCLPKDNGLNSLSIIVPLLTACLNKHHICSPSQDDCLLVKIYQGCLIESSFDIPCGNRILLQLQVLVLVNDILSRDNEVLPHLVDCHCTLELLKLLVCLLNKEIVFLKVYSPDDLMSNENTRLSLKLLCNGLYLLASLASSSSSSRLFTDLRILVGHKYNNLVIGFLRLFKEIPSLRNINEVLIDLLDESIEEHEALGEDGVEEMEVCE